MTHRTSRTANTPNVARSDDWFTPKHIIDALGPFDLDPCTSRDRPWDTADYHFTHSGLEREWEGFVWLNPPYSNTRAWINKLVDYGRGIALVFARTETKWWRELVWSKADAILFLEGRVHFRSADDPKPNKTGGQGGGSPSALVAYGIDACHRLEASGLAGALVTGWVESGAQA